MEQVEAASVAVKENVPLPLAAGASRERLFVPAEKEVEFFYSQVRPLQRGIPVLRGGEEKTLAGRLKELRELDRDSIDIL